MVIQLDDEIVVSLDGCDFYLAIFDVAFAKVVHIAISKTGETAKQEDIPDAMEIEFRLGNFIVLQFRNLFLREEDDFFLCLLEFWPECLKLIVFMETLNINCVIEK